MPYPDTLASVPTIRRIDGLVQAGLVPQDQAAGLAAVTERFALAVTPQIAALIDPDDPDDPIARQFVPQVAELRVLDQERADPIGDHAHAPVPGVVHRYPDRALLKPLHSCPVYCRFCFRREQVGPGGDALRTESLDRAFRYLAGATGLREVILSGGDPLMLSPDRLRGLVQRVAALDQVEVLRVHSRVPVVDSERVSDAMVQALRSTRLPAWVVVHVNHARELSPPSVDALTRLVDGGVPVLSQTVLLRGVNDSVGALEDLLRSLVRLRVKPYYLHHGDLAAGTGHLRTSVQTGQEIMRALRGRLSGLALPTYVLDIPGGYGKVPIGPVFLRRDQGWVVTDPWGGEHAYSDTASRT